MFPATQNTSKKSWGKEHHLASRYEVLDGVLALFCTHLLLLFSDELSGLHSLFLSLPMNIKRSTGISTQFQLVNGLRVCKPRLLNVLFLHQNYLYMSWSDQSCSQGWFSLWWRIIIIVTRIMKTSLKTPMTSHAACQWVRGKMTVSPGMFNITVSNTGNSWFTW